ncbi:protein spindle-F [Cephus cinctus]|uniref:Protein spindle-F n=1 Tax=Cephus cinctus TaxID=211228 RepID=A0AAJ7FEY6_CEPCN|nr:protein spindle-F [Cephus cinctus]
MDSSSGTDPLMDQTSESEYALQLAFQTMKERCQQLQNRLAVVEEENLCLRLECGKDTSTAVVRGNASSERTVVQTLQEKVEDLTKQKSQLTHYIFMVAAENRQLWNRLTRLAKTNKSLGRHLNKISDTLKEHPPMTPSDVLSYSFRDISSLIKNESTNCLPSTNNENRQQSLDEMSLKILNSLKLRKSELEQQCAEMVEMQNSFDLNLRNGGFTYPEDGDVDSLQQLKQHDVRLSQTKDALLAQQAKLKSALRNLEIMKKGVTCKNCRDNARKEMCQIGTQCDSDDSLKEHGATQTSFLLSGNSDLASGQNVSDSDKKISERVCPLCGALYGKSTTFSTFHEHVLNHFTEEEWANEFEVVH